MPYKKQIQNYQAKFTELGKEIEAAKSTNNPNLVEDLIKRRLAIYDEICRLNKLQFDAVHNTFDMDDR